MYSYNQVADFFTKNKDSQNCPRMAVYPQTAMLFRFQLNECSAKSFERGTRVALVKKLQDEMTNKILLT